MGRDYCFERKSRQVGYRRRRERVSWNPRLPSNDVPPLLWINEVLSVDPVPYERVSGTIITAWGVRLTQRSTPQLA